MSMANLVPEPVLAAVGDLTISFANLEMHVELVVWSLVSSNTRIGQAITSELGFSRLPVIALSIYRELHGEDEDFMQLQELMKQSLSMAEERNSLIHSVWGVGDSEDSAIRAKVTAKLKHGVRFDSHPVDVAEVRAAAERMRVISGQILLFVSRLMRTGKSPSQFQRLPSDLATGESNDS